MLLAVARPRLRIEERKFPARVKREACCAGIRVVLLREALNLVDRRREADWIARRIRNLLDVDKTLVWDKKAKKVREVRPGDVALLFRALSNVEYYEDALQRHGIDYYLVGGHAFYAQQEIYDLLNLLRTLDSPGDEVSLAGVLRSPMFSLHDETLFWLCNPAGQGARGLAAALWAAELPVEIEGERVVGKGSSTDVIEASVRAYLNAINKVVARRGHGKQSGEATR